MHLRTTNTDSIRTSCDDGPTGKFGLILLKNSQHNACLQAGWSIPEPDDTCMRPALEYREFTEILISGHDDSIFNERMCKNDFVAWIVLPDISYTHNFMSS